MAVNRSNNKISFKLLFYLWSRSITPLKQGGADSAYQGQLFDFVSFNRPFTNPFQNAEPLGITLKAGMKPAEPGYRELREVIYRLVARVSSGRRIPGD